MCVSVSVSVSVCIRPLAARAEAVTRSGEVETAKGVLVCRLKRVCTLASVAAHLEVFVCLCVCLCVV
jgi:hypothetical protein